MLRGYADGAIGNRGVGPLLPVDLPDEHAFEPPGRENRRCGYRRGEEMARHALIAAAAEHLQRADAE